MPAGVDALSINLDNVNSVARRYIMPEIEDAVYNSNVTAQKAKAMKESIPGYPFVTGPVQYGEGPGGPYTGTQPFDISDAQILTSYQFSWKTHFASGTVTLFDQDRTNGPDAIGNLFNIKFDQMEETLSNYFGIAFHNDGSNLADYIGLQAQVAATGSVGGISKTLNTWWASPIDSTTNLAGLSESAARTLRGRATQDMRKPNWIVTTQAIYDRLYAINLTNKRYVNTQDLQGGFNTLSFEDMPVEVDSHVPAGRLYMLYLKTFHYKVNRNRNMYFTGWKAPHNPPTYTSAYILHMACFFLSNPRFSAAFTALT